MSSTTARFKFTDVLGAPVNDDSVVVDALSLDNSIHFRALVPLSGQTDVSITLRDAASGIYRPVIVAASTSPAALFLPFQSIYK